MPAVHTEGQADVPDGPAVPGVPITVTWSATAVQLPAPS
jgi:hypothetical protein